MSQFSPAFRLRIRIIARQSAHRLFQPACGSMKSDFSTMKGNQAGRTRDNQKQFDSFSRRIASAASRKPAAYESHATRFARGNLPTLLYRAPSPMPYTFGCYFVGAGLFAMAGYHYSSQFAIPDDVGKGLPRYVTTFNLISSLALAVAASWMCLRPQNLVQSITLIPSRSHTGARSVLLQIQRSSTMPLISPQSVSVPSADVSISSPLFTGNDDQILAEMAELQRRKERANAFDNNGGLLTLPVRQASYWMGRSIAAVKKALFNEGFLKLHLKGRNITWKLEKDADWALDDGQALDKLVKIRIV